MTHRTIFTALTLAIALLWGPLATAAAVGENPDDLGAYKRLSDASYLLVLRPGAKVIESLVAFQAATGIKSAAVTGVGTTRDTLLSFYKFGEDGQPGKTHTDDRVAGHREIVALTCILTTRVVEAGKADVQAPPHCHIAVSGSDEQEPTGKGWAVVGGHLLEAEVAVTAELVITAYPADVVKRPSAVFGGIVVDVGAGQGGQALRRLAP